jgi:hypothetical protein
MSEVIPFKSIEKPQFSVGDLVIIDNNVQIVFEVVTSEKGYCLVSPLEPHEKITALSFEEEDNILFREEGNNCFKIPTSKLSKFNK